MSETSTSQSRPFPFPLAALAAATALALTACGGGGGGGSSDNTGGSPPAGTGSAPVAVDDTARMTPGQPVTVDVLANDRDADNNIAIRSVRFVNPPSGATLSADGRTLTLPGEGVWTVNSQGQVTFTPNTGFTGTPSTVAYTVSDHTNLTSAPASITLTLITSPAPSGDTLTQCHNPAMYQAGTSWSITYSGGSTTTYTVLDATTYRDRSTVRIQMRQPNTTAISYEAADDKFSYIYGGEYTITDPTTGASHSNNFYYDPPRRGPLTLTPGQSFSDRFVHHQSGESAVNNFIVTFEAFETITVPAGTFLTCRVRHTFPDSGARATSWAVASGRFTGMVVRAESYNPDGTLGSNSVATALSINR